MTIHNRVQTSLWSLGHPDSPTILGCGYEVTAEFRWSQIVTPVASVNLGHMGLITHERIYCTHIVTWASEQLGGPLAARWLIV